MSRKFTIKPKFHKAAYMILIVLLPVFGLLLSALVELTFSNSNYFPALLLGLFWIYRFLYYFFGWEVIEVFEDRVAYQKGLGGLGFKRFFEKEKILLVKLHYTYEQSSIEKSEIRFHWPKLFGPTQWSIELWFTTRKKKIGRNLSRTEASEILAELRRYEYRVAR